MKLLPRLINPISIIAIFAALCEASATTVLPQLDEENRQIYIWFLIAFPSVLVVLFFLTLNFNHQVLYAPKDRALETSDTQQACNETHSPLTFENPSHTKNRDTP